jgi:hypothetical protein
MTDHTTQQFWDQYAKPGATHYNPETKDWYRVEGDTALAWATVEGGWVNAACWHERKHLCVARPVAQWDGEGNAPAGTSCEMTHVSWRERGWAKVIVNYMSDTYAITSDECGEQHWHRRDVIFRAMPTPAQLAAEKREAEIDAICYDITLHYGNPKGSEHYLGLATKLHNLGYRKPEKE